MQFLNAVLNAIAAPITTHYFRAHISDVNDSTKTHYNLMLVNTLQKLNSNPGDIPHSNRYTRYPPRTFRIYCAECSCVHTHIFPNVRWVNTTFAGLTFAVAIPKAAHVALLHLTCHGRGHWTALATRDRTVLGLSRWLSCPQLPQIHKVPTQDITCI